MLMVAPVKEEKRIPMTDEQRDLFGIDKLNIPRSNNSVHYTCGLQCENTDGGWEE